MKATIDRLTMKDALATLNLIPAGRVTLPALSGVRIEARDDGRVVLQATDLSVAVTVTVRADVTEPGTVLVPRKVFAQTVARGADRLTLTADEVAPAETSSLTVDVGASTEVRGMILADYPQLAGPAPDAPSVTLDADDLATLARVAPAASTDESRPVLTGVLIDGDRVVASDSYRLHAGTLTRAAHGPAANVPARTVGKVARWKATGGILLTVEDEQVTFAATIENGPKKARRSHEVRATSKLIEGAFPNYRALMPDDPGTVFTFDAGALADALGQLSPIASHGVPVVMEPTVDGRMRVTVSSQETGTAEAFVPVGVDGPGVCGPFAYNPRFLAAAVEAAEHGGGVSMAVRDGLKPALLDGRVTALIMPMRIS